MSVDTVVRARIDSRTKEQAAAALAAMGLSVSDFIRMALVRVAHDKAIPFAVKVRNAGSDAGGSCHGPGSFRHRVGTVRCP